MKKIKSLVYICLISVFCIHTYLYSANTVLNSDTLLDAIVRSDLKTMVKCLDNGVSPNSKDSNGNAVLLLAINMGFKDGANLLIKRGANVNESYSRGMN
ncbi:MAG: hypothetical protein PHH62_01750, partial [Endomicrobiaceae bacterium]|nr:hypothetical protein [Endomicrobiaceae bacterium]